MKKMMLLATMVAIAALMMAAAPAFADHNRDGFDDAQFFCDNDDDDFNGYIECDDLFVVIPVDDFDFDDFDRNDFCDFYDFDCKDNNNNNNNNKMKDVEITQEFDQEAESGDIDQSFNVSQKGDNSNQCVGINATANTGNVQNQSGFIITGSEIDDFEQNDVSNSLKVGGSSTTTCDQQVNQLAIVK
ncbi:MAG: hypothetical protein M3122_00010 [Actinomycetota bacterium]|nr:hypothetical protein [Actinomycetota bacterium]